MGAFAGRGKRPDTACAEVADDLAEAALGAIESDARAAADRARAGKCDRARLAADRAALADLVRMQFSVAALLTSCGMSAFATILAHVERESVPGTRIVAGRGLYHECRGLLTRSSLGSVVEVDRTIQGRS